MSAPYAGSPSTGRYADALEGQRLPTEWSLTARTTVATLAMLGQLHASANWHRVAREWIYGDPPVTELGLLDATYRTERGTDPWKVGMRETPRWRSQTQGDGSRNSAVANP